MKGSGPRTRLRAKAGCIIRTATCLSACTKITSLMDTGLISTKRRESSTQATTSTTNPTGKAGRNGQTVPSSKAITKTVRKTAQGSSSGLTATPTPATS